MYCPEGSAEPSFVSLGYYSTGGEEHMINGTTTSIENVRTGQAICPAGHFCEDGEMKPCNAGLYGSNTGLYKEGCSGFCPAGHYCTQGTAEPIECPDNSYSSVGSHTCISCVTQSRNGASRCKNDRLCCFQYM